MTALKTCDTEELLKNEDIADHYSNYDNIIKLCENKRSVPAISRERASSLLSRLKKNVKDFYSINASIIQMLGMKVSPTFKHCSMLP